MLEKMREVLLTQYIGAILIALLVFQSALDIVAQIVRSGYWWWYSQSHRRTLLGDPSEPQYRWDNLILTFFQIGLYLLVAYWLTEWLYPQKAVGPPNSTEGELGNGENQ